MEVGYNFLACNRCHFVWTDCNDSEPFKVETLLDLPLKIQNLHRLTLHWVDWTIQSFSEMSEFTDFKIPFPISEWHIYSIKRNSHKTSGTTLAYPPLDASASSTSWRKPGGGAISLRGSDMPREVRQRRPRVYKSSYLFMLPEAGISPVRHQEMIKQNQAETES